MESLITAGSRGMISMSAFLCGIGHAETLPAAPPNIIFFLTDDMGSGDGQVLGHPYMITPNLDRLAREGTSFTQFYIASPVCSPSRAAFLTGRFPAELGIHHIFGNIAQTEQWGNAQYLPAVPTVMSLLKTAGYRTGHFGKWHLTATGTFTPPVPEDYGIDEIKIGGGFGRMVTPRWDTSDPFYRAKSTGLFVDAAIDFIERNKQSPFYINIWALVPHAPLNPTTEEMAEYSDLKVSANDFSGFMKDYVERAKDPQSQMTTYCASMTGLDQALGRLLDYLDQNGLSENTILIFSSDNGPEDYAVGEAKNAGMGSPGNSRARKRSLYEGGTKVPFMIRWPGTVPAGKTDNTSILGAVDLLPTLTAVAGVSPVAASNGENVVDAWQGKAFVRNKPLFWEWRWTVLGNAQYAAPQLAVRQGDWKFLCMPDGSGAELYNLKSDPEERSNDVAENPEIAQSLKELVQSWKSALSN